MARSTLTFNGNVSQVLAGDGSAAPATGSGITITDTSGVLIPVIDARPTVTGIGTNTLTLSFTGSGVVGGKLPAGMYQLNFVGNGFVANGRAVDVANNGTQVGGFREFEFTAITPTPLTGDYNDNGTVDAADYVVWRKSVGQTGAGLAADGDGDMDVDENDYLVWRANFGSDRSPWQRLLRLPRPPSSWKANYQILSSPPRPVIKLSLIGRQRPRRRRLTR